MRCPSCQLETPGELLYCARCDSRLFAWLGDPFGNLELSGAGAAVAAARPRAEVQPGGSFPWGKVVTAGILVWLVHFLSPVVSPVLAAASAVLLLRRPRVSWLSFVSLFGALTVAIVLLRPAFAPLDPAAKVTPAPTPMPAQATAAAVKQEAIRYQQGGIIKWRQGDFVGAEQDLTRAIELWTTAEPTYYRYRALARIAQGKHDEALADASQAVSINRVYVDVRAYVYLKRGQYREALLDYDAVLASTQNPPMTSRLGRGLALAGLQETQSAFEELKAGLALTRPPGLDPQMDDLLAEAQRTAEAMRNGH